jgi:hypothetical protein
MKKHNTNIGAELLSLLRQQRYWFHQLKTLTAKQQELVRTSSPELMLELISGRRKLIEKLREVDNKLRPVRTNWQTLSGQIGADYKKQIHEMANEVREIVSEIPAAVPSETTQNSLLHQDWGFGELFAETQNGFPFCKESPNRLGVDRKEYV